MALTKVGKEGITGISNSSDATAITIGSSENVTFAAATRAPNSSASAPSYAFSNDTSSGMFLPAADKLGFASAGSERMRIDNSGNVIIGTANRLAGGSAYFNNSINLQPGSDSIFHRDSGSVVDFSRGDDDGQIVRFVQDNSVEGTISVSGTTVSYNGGHLARWSQATDGKRIDGLVKGTVMTNLDQMAEWTKDGVTENNEQLNCMAVSSVEGDVNVAGVFVNWDEDDKDYTADMNVAMTGDMVIRIAKDTTVARGDLLMSAGDGTAKPQGDDIVRSKTIAKVTSITKSHTYDDGTYLVPCVLMAC